MFEGQKILAWMIFPQIETSLRKKQYICGRLAHFPMNRNKEIYKVTLWGGAVNVLLLIFKFVAGVLGNSAAMVADAVHSLSDFVTDVVVLAFVGVSARPQDRSHDFGHGKFETIATFFIGLALILTAVMLLVREGKLDLDHKISHAFHFLDAQKAFDFNDPGDPSIRKIVLTFD